MNKSSRRLFLIVAVVLAAALSFVWGWRQSQLDKFRAACQSAANAKDWTRLELLGREWSRKAPDEPLAWYWLGESLQAQRRYLDSVNAFTQIPIDGPRGIDAANARMQLLFHALDRPRDALVIADKLLEIDPRLPDPRRNRIYFFAMTRQRSRVLPDIREAIVHRADLPDHYIYLLNVEDMTFRDGDIVTQKWLRQNPDDHEIRIANLFHRARNARASLIVAPTPEREAEHKRLQAEVAENLSRFPMELSLLEFTMTIAMDRGDMDAIGDLLASAPESAGEDLAFWLWRGRYAIHTKDFEDAEKSLLRVIELAPLAWQARNDLAQVHRFTNRPESAGSFQKLAVEGARLAEVVRLKAHIRDVSSATLTEIGKYASDCGDWQVADGVYRRNLPKNPTK
ncbi:MAG: hypothetical protein H7Z17_19045 [Fuerstia sp.]|nr:hypothetical protein [Fuerstiella sp.]